MSSDLIYTKLLKRYAEPWPSPPPPQEDSHEFLHALLDAVERDSRRGLVSRGERLGARTVVEDLFQGRTMSQVRDCRARICGLYYIAGHINVVIWQGGNMGLSYIPRENHEPGA